jgi:hypothetical protein
MFFRLRRVIHGKLFDLACAGVLKTRPLQMKPSNLIICSMVSHTDLKKYLLAVKSLYGRIGHGSAMVIDDGSLTPSDREAIKHHLPLVEFIALRSISATPCPRGGCWERLLTVTELCRDHYVIQVDSDTLTVGDVEEVVECVRLNRSFTLGGEAAARILSLDKAEDNATLLASTDTHIQDTIERKLAELPPSLGKRYVRGSAGFAGFARGAADRDLACRFSVAAERLVGPRFTEWGSEQVASNYLIANAPDAVVLPYAKYLNFEMFPISNPSFIHYFGTFRYRKFDYIRRARTLIAAWLA